MTAAATTVMTVTGPIAASAMGTTLTHEHLLNDVRLAVQPGARTGTEDLLNAAVTAENRQRLLTEPYSSYDNCTLDSKVDAAAELMAFAALGGSTIVDVTPPTLGRDPRALRELSERSGVNVVMGSGWYLERFDSGARGSIQQMVDELSGEFEKGVDGVFPGVIGEIGVSADFTAGEQRALRAACIVQRQQKVPLFIHLPGWQRRGPEILDIVLYDMGVAPDAVVLCHMDPSGSDTEYQTALASRGVWLEFDMIGMPFEFPGEGSSPAVDETIAAIAALVAAGAADRLLFSHDLFLKAMLHRLGGDGLGFVPGAFRSRARSAGIDSDHIIDVNPSLLFTHASHPIVKN